MEKPDEKKLGRTGFRTLDSIIRDPPQAVNSGPRRQKPEEMLGVPVDSRAFAMYQNGPVAEKS